MVDIDTAEDAALDAMINAELARAAAAEAADANWVKRYHVVPLALLCVMIVATPYLLRVILGV